MNASPSPVAIAVTQLSKSFQSVTALDSVSFTLPEGNHFAVLGPNGAGKTTLIRILCTLLPPDSGTAVVAGADVQKHPVAARRSIGVVFQDSSLDERLTVLENLEFHGLVYGMPAAARRERIAAMLALVGLEEWRHSVVRGFSGGMKRRLEIARALLHQPRILFLDEPTAGLDVQTRQNIWRYLDDLRAQQPLTIVTTTHYIEEVEEADQVCIIHEGRIRALDSPQALKATHGSASVRVVPRHEEDRLAIRAAYPDALEQTRGRLLLRVEDAGFMDRFLAQFGNRVREAAFETSNLENVFVSLTGRELMDETYAPAARRRNPRT